MNDIFWLAQKNKEISLERYQWERTAKHLTDDAAVSDALKANQQVPEAVKLAGSIAKCLTTFDWRSSSAVRKTEEAYDRQATYRGSGGYKAIRENTLRHLLKPDSPKSITIAAEELLDLLGYETEET